MVQLPYYDSLQGISFLNSLFKKHHELFGSMGSFVFYLMYSGQLVKPDALISEFESFITSSNPKSIQTLLTNPANIYAVEGITIFTWARYLMETSTFIVYEPILKLNNITLQSFLQTKKFIWNGKSYSIEDIRPIAFNNVGENITNLLPYIAYLFNFLINCAPYEFNSVANGNVQTVYIQQMNQYFETGWKKLIKNYPMLRIEQFYQSLDDDSIFSIVNKEDIKSLLNDLLAPENVLAVRNQIIENNPEILSACVKDQLVLSQENVTQGFNEVFTRLADTIILHNPIYKLREKLPYFSNMKPDMNYTWRIVEWCLTGSSNSFFITDNYEFLPTRHKLEKYLGIPAMAIETDIQTNVLCSKVPFLLSDPAQQIVTGYIEQQFNELLSDITINTDTVLPTEDDTNEQIEGELFNTFINGFYAKHNKFLSKYFNVLPATDRLLINKLSSSLNKFYNNQFTNNIIRTYIFSYLPEYLLKFIVSYKSKVVSLRTFSNIIYFCLNGEFDTGRAAAIINMQYALMCVHTKSFVNLVNAMSNRITSIIINNSYIFQPYIKSITDNVHQWIIGGITLCQKAVISNPIVRGIEFIRHVLGTTEKLENMKDWMEALNNQTVNETIEEFISRNELDSIKNILISRFNNAQKRHICLENWELDNNQLKQRFTAYFLDNLQAVIPYCFSKFQAKNIQSPELFWRPLKITTTSKTTSHPFKNKFFIGKTECTSYIIENGEYVSLPVIQFNSEIETISIVYQPPNGLKVIKILTPSGLYAENNAFFIFTTAQTSEEWITKDIDYEGLTKMTIDGGTVKVNPGTF